MNKVNLVVATTYYGKVMERDRYRQGVKANKKFMLFTFWPVQLGTALARYIILPRYVVTISMDI
jgi:hypothetical protein